MTGLPRNVTRDPNSFGSLFKHVRNAHDFPYLARDIRRIATDAMATLQTMWTSPTLDRRLEVTPTTTGPTAFPAGHYPWTIASVVAASGARLRQVGDVMLERGYAFVKGADTFRSAVAGQALRISYRQRLKNPAVAASNGYDVLARDYAIAYQAILHQALLFYSRHDEAAAAMQALKMLISDERDSVASRAFRDGARRVRRRRRLP